MRKHNTYKILGVKMSQGIFNEVKADAMANNISVPCWIADAVALFVGTEPKPIAHHYEPCNYPDIRFGVSLETYDRVKSLSESMNGGQKIPLTLVIKSAIIECL